MRRLSSIQGFSLLEVLLCVLIAGVLYVSVGAFPRYSSSASDTSSLLMSKIKLMQSAGRATPPGGYSGTIKKPYIKVESGVVTFTEKESSTSTVLNEKKFEIPTGQTVTASVGTIYFGKDGRAQDNSGNILTPTFTIKTPSAADVKITINNVGGLDVS